MTAFAGCAIGWCDLCSAAILAAAFDLLRCRVAWRQASLFVMAPIEATSTPCTFCSAISGLAKNWWRAPMLLSLFCCNSEESGGFSEPSCGFFPKDSGIRATAGLPGIVTGSSGSMIPARSSTSNTGADFWTNSLASGKSRDHWFYVLPLGQACDKHSRLPGKGREPPRRETFVFHPDRICMAKTTW
jgi:hypothetical protein